MPAYQVHRMNFNQFAESVSQFESWKSTIAKELKSFRLWLRRNQLCDDNTDERVKEMLNALGSDFLTIAFTGEFSRGKTELINAIFFADYGQRILPSQAGRTTMCPTELFFDKDSEKSYLRLLPIETRLQETALTDFRQMSSAWVEIPLHTESPQEMSQAMQSITYTKVVSRVDAIALGFDASSLDESDEEPGKVEIPAWRHALISFNHPLLRQGLRLFDTPGLNALGSEPELTFNLLPQAQAVVFVLAADAGVTASDMAVWEEHIEPLKNRPNLGLYAALNKIDVLWDELSSRKKVEKSINRVTRQTARHLKLDENNILPVSAQKALLGKVKDDKALVLSSQIQQLEHILSEEILGNKEDLLWDGIIQQSTQLINESRQLLEYRREQLEEQRKDLEKIQNDQENELKLLLDKSKMAQREFTKRHLTLKPSLRLLDRQTEILLKCVSQKNLNTIIQQAMKDLIKSKTTLGMLRTMKNFSSSIDSLMNEFSREAELSNKMAVSMYSKFEKDFDVDLLEPRQIKARGIRKQLQSIFDDANHFNRNFLVTFSEQSVAVKRFFTTTVNNTAQYFKAIRNELLHWTKGVKNPLTQQVKSQKDLLASHHKQLLALQRNDATVEGQLKALKSLVLEVDTELVKADESLKALKRAAPKHARENVIKFARNRT